MRTRADIGVDQYAGGIGIIDDARAAGLNLMPVAALAGNIHAAVVWFSAWHLAAASLTVPEVVRVIDATAATALVEPQVPLPPPSRPVPRTSPAAEPPAPSRPAPAVIGQGVTSGLVKAARSVADRLAMARKTVSGILDETAKVRAERLREAEAARQAAVARFRETGSARPAIQPAAVVASGAAPRLDVNRMRTPVAGTWLMLVVLSWVALFWGALLAVPFVGPFGLVAAVMGGFWAVPLWGTVWGFLGMGPARASTLAQMGFSEAKPGSWLAETTARMARDLDLPPPTVGTIPVFNAFAMGTDHRDATVAIGTPLMETLSRDETSAVIAHELGHVVSGDMRKMMLMRTFQNACVWYMLAQGLKQFMRWVISRAAELAILAFSRRREYWADAVGAALTSKEAMIGALRKLEHAPAMTSGETANARFKPSASRRWRQGRISSGCR